MTKGVLGIIICPMNDDQLLYYLCNDAEVDRIVLLDNDHSKGIQHKLEKRNAKFEIVPENMFDEGNMEFEKDRFTVVIKTNSLGLHAEPAKLRRYIEDQIRDIQPHIDALGVYYGICGSFGWDLPKWAEEKGYKPTAVFVGDDGRVCDDCVAIAVGSSTRYLELEKAYTGMFYVTPSIASNWVDFVMAGNDADQFKNIPPETLEELGIHNNMDFMRWLFELGNYRNILKLDTGFSDSEIFEKEVEDIGEVLRLRPINVEPGWVTAKTAESLYVRCKNNLNKTANT